jgi:hypothetical protein
VRERRVLSALSIHIDLANSTDDALKWLCQGDYDILITNLTRPNDGAAPCTDSPDAAQRAGCYLIKQVAQLEQLKKTKTPKIIIYAIKTEGVVHSTKNVSVTNTAGDFLMPSSTPLNGWVIRNERSTSTVYYCELCYCSCPHRRRPA